MSLNVEFINNGDYLEVKATGKYSLEEAIKHFPKVLDTCADLDLTKVLIDYSKLQGNIYALQKILYTDQTIFILKKHYAETGKDIKFAYLGGAHVSEYEPGQELADIKGMQSITTNDINEALSWLDVKKR